MIKDIEPSDLQQRRQSGEPWQLLDVREAWEIEIASIDGTLNMPVARVPERKAELDPRLPVAVLCHTGVRSLRVATYLDDLGYDQVVNVRGGIDRWSLTVDPAIARY